MFVTFHLCMPVQYWKQAGGKPARRGWRSGAKAASLPPPRVSPLISAVLALSPGRSPRAPRRAHFEPAAALWGQSPTRTISSGVVFPGEITRGRTRSNSQACEFHHGWAASSGTPAAGRLPGAVHGASLSTEKASCVGRTRLRILYKQMDSGLPESSWRNERSENSRCCSSTDGLH